MGLFSGKNNSGTKSAQKEKGQSSTRKYTTRQIMELTELRRRQEELAAQNIKSSLSQTDDGIVFASPVPDAPPAERLPSDIPAAVNRIDGELKAVEADGSDAHPGLVKKSKAQRSPRWLVAAQSAVGDWKDMVMQSAFTAAVSVLFFSMLSHILNIGSTDDYAQGPFIFLAVLLTVWAKRTQFSKGERSFVLGLAAIILGLGIFIQAAYQESVYLEVFAFTLTVAGIFCVRYTKEAASLLILPLLGLVFAVAPPANVTAVLAPSLNQPVAQVVSDALKILGIPSAFNGWILDAGGYQFAVDKDLGAFRFFMAALPLMFFYVQFRRMNNFRKRIVFLSVIPLTGMAVIAHWTMTGWTAYTYGNPYADAVYSGLAGLMLLTVLSVFVLVDSFRMDDEHI